MATAIPPPHPASLPAAAPRSRRLVWWALGAVSLVPVLVIAAYVLNPADVPSPDPRGRLAGYIPYTLRSDSMAPTFPAGTQVVACTWAYVDAEPARGDVVAFWPPHSDVPWAKRIVGLEGEVLRLENGVLYANDEPVDEPYLYPGDENGTDFVTVVPEDHVYVVGDYRSRSMDSRHFGPVATSSIIGKVCARL